MFKNRDCTNYSNTDVLRPKAIEKHKDSPINIGWIGSPTTWHYFEKKLPMMKSLASIENGNLL